MKFYILEGNLFGLIAAMIFCNIGHGICKVVYLLGCYEMIPFFRLCNMNNKKRDVSE